VNTKSEFSNEVSTVGFSCLPAKPDLVVAAQCDDINSQLKLSWQDDPNTQYWSIYKKREGETGFNHVINISSPTLSYIDNNVEDNIKYEYYLEAVGIGVSTSSDLIEETSLFCYNLPYDGEAFSISTETVCYGYSSRAKVNWPEDPTGNTMAYGIWRKNISLGETSFSEIYTGISASVHQYFDYSGIQEGDVYVYMVEAIGSEAYTFSLESDQTIIENCTTTLPLPSELTLDGIKSTGDMIGVWVHWTDAGNEEYYEIWRTGSDFNKIDQVGGKEIPGDTYWVDSNWDRGLDDGKNYQYKIIAVNAYGQTESNIIAVNVPIAKPGDFSITGVKVGDSSFQITWTEASTTSTGGPITYEVLKDETANFSSPETICTIACTELICEETLECLDGSFSSIDIFYRVVANNAGGSNSSTIVFLTFVLPTWKETAPW